MKGKSGVGHQRCYVSRMLLMTYVMKWPVRLPNLKVKMVDPRVRYRGQACAPEIILLYGGAGGHVIYIFLVSVGKELPETPAGLYLAIRWVYLQEA